MKQLSLIEISFFLKKISIFEELDLDFLLSIADKISQDIYDKDEKIFIIDQNPLKMYFINEGSVGLYDRKNNLIKTLFKENFFAEEDIFKNSLRSYSAICLKDSLLLSIPKEALFAIISEIPSVAISFLKNYAKRIYF